MLTIAGKKIRSPFVLAPLAGYTDLPFRLLCREYGAALVVSEMISCHALIYKQQKTLKMLATCLEDRPLSIQLFGADPEIMGEAASILNDFSPDFIDINMGCPVKKVTKKGAGSALMKDQMLAEKIIKAVVNNSNAPVTVKTRIGIDSQTLTAKIFAKISAESGAAAITIHGRTWSQGFSGMADWNEIQKVKATATLPVIGNGDINSWQDGMEKLYKSGCDGIMIGRCALGNPWIFSKQGRPKAISKIVVAALRHLQLMEQHLDIERKIAVIRNQTGRYFYDLPGSSQIRQTIHSCHNFELLKQYITSLA